MADTELLSGFTFQTKLFASSKIIFELCDGSFSEIGLETTCISVRFIILLLSMYSTNSFTKKLPPVSY